MTDTGVVFGIGGPAAGPSTALLTGARSFAWLDRGLTRLGIRSVFARDSVLAVILAGLTVLVAGPLLGPTAGVIGLVLTPGQSVLVLVLTVFQSLALCLRRVRPVACVLVMPISQLALGAVLPDHTTVRLLAPLVAVYSAGTLLAVRRLVVLLSAALVIEFGGGVLVTTLLAPSVRENLGAPASTGPGPTAGVLLAGGASVFLLYAAAALTGLVVAARRERFSWLQAQAVAAVHDQELRAAAAVDAERARLARELHDVAAHHLTALVVQAGAVEKLLDRDPEAARAAVRTLRIQGREVLASLRSVVGVLRDRSGPERVTESAASTDEPVPGLARLDDLVTMTRELGEDVVLAHEGTPRQLPALSDLTAYRVVQEGLSNARQHAPGATVWIGLDFTDVGLQVEVVNMLPTGFVRLPAGERGFGLLGMRERAQLAGGRLEAGPTPEGRWRVLLEVPG